VETLLSDRETLLERLPLEASGDGNSSRSSSVSVSMSLERRLYSCREEQGAVRQRREESSDAGRQSYHRQYGFRSWVALPIVSVAIFIKDARRLTFVQNVMTGLWAQGPV
jgi:hypothetical protein